MKTKQEQIEDMAKAACAACGRDGYHCPLPAKYRPCDASLKYAEAVYDAGYRKVLLDTENGKEVDVAQYDPWQLVDGYTEREVEDGKEN